MPAQHVTQFQLLSHRLYHGGFTGSRRAGQQQWPTDAQGGINRVSKPWWRLEFQTQRRPRKLAPRRRRSEPRIVNTAVTAIIRKPGHMHSLVSRSTHLEALAELKPFFVIPYRPEIREWIGNSL